jgi:hypothetical protein
MGSNNIKKIMENYTNLYIPRNKDDNKCITSELISSIIIWILTGYAAYLSFKCSKGFNLGQLLLAVFFSPFYIIYHIFATNLCNTI